MEKTRNTEEEKKMGQKWVKEEHKASTSRVNTGFPVNTGKLSPMMKEYVKTKEEYSDCILFYRLGDFYEMFFDDALTASKELEITLTGKDCGLEERAPMCGVPFHAAETYINRLIEKGYKVAICEQVEDPKKAKGLVKREVVRIVTPGTTLDTMSLDESKNNYLMSIVSIGEHFGCAIADITTGDCFLTELDKPQKLLDEINKFTPAEIICNDAFLLSGVDVEDLKGRLGICVFALDPWCFDDQLCQETLKEHFHVGNLEGLGIGDYDSGIIASGALFLYLKETQKTALSHMASIRPYSAEKYMLIDSSSRRNLELVETMREKQKRGSLLWVLDKTRTAMGARTLRKFVEQPLIDKNEINRRLDAVEELKEQAISREEIREYLSPVYDLERLITKITYGSANPRDLTAFKSSLEMLPPIRYILEEMKVPLLQEIYEDLDALEDLLEAQNGKPALIAYWYKHERDSIMQRFDCREIKTNADIADWNKGKIPVALIQPSSAGHGLNLQSGGSTIIWYTMPWSLELYQQTNARLWRQGQQSRTVVIHHLVSAGTIDEDIMKVLKMKDKTQAAMMRAVKARGKA